MRQENLTEFGFETQAQTGAFADFADEVHGSPWNGEPAHRQEEISADVSLAPEEAFLGDAAVSEAMHDSHDLPVQRGAWGDLSPEEDERRLGGIISGVDHGSTQGVDPGMARGRSTGRYRRDPTLPAPRTPSNRDPVTGTYVDAETTDPGIRRDPETGRFL